MNIDNFEILKSRNGNTVPVTVSAASISDIRTQNTNPSQPGARLKSIVVDGVNLVSPLATQVLNVDYTQPSSVGIVRDGTTANDISTTTFTSQLSANWNTSVDPNSGIAKYWCAIGTTSGSTNVSGWRENGMSTSVTRAGLILSVGTTYYISVKAENAAGLQSAVTTSNGQKVISPLTSESLVGSVKSEVREYGSALKEFNAYPNPARREINVEYVLNELTDVRLSLHDSYGKEIAIIINDEKQSAGEYLFHYTLPYVFSKGIYTLIIKTGTNIRTFKIVID
jgi:hypothetical protein